MNQQPDKLFRDKLESFQKNPPPSAWEKIAAAQAKKNNKGLWLKIAAALVLPALAGYLLWSTINSNDRRTTIATTTPATKTPAQSETALKKKDSVEQKSIDKVPVQKENKTSVEKKTTPPKKTNDNRSNAVTNSPEEERKLVQQQPVQKKVETEELIVPIEESIETNVAIVQTPESPKQSKSIKLVFSADETDKYLDKKSLAEATSDDKKPSTLKKLLQKANDLKNNQDPFGELRQKKNEILALNFKSEKLGQNK